ncbi:MAG: metallophosphoesterase [Clostridia bacterium]|nr:metallophosphoesterase [Clostridia bacterium]
MKIFAISDLHLSINNSKPMNIFGPVWEGYLDKIVQDWTTKVTDQDVVLLCGDLSWAMRLEDTKPDFEFLSKLPGKKIIIKGNHDYWWGTISKVRGVLPKNVYALQNDAIEIENYVFCGSRGWLLEDNKAFLASDQKIVDRELIRLEMSFQMASKLKKDGQKLICLMHYPPFDKFNQPTAFTKLIEKYNVDAVVYGHLHGKVPQAKEKIVLNDIVYYLTSCDMVKNKLVEIKTLDL